MKFWALSEVSFKYVYNILSNFNAVVKEQHNGRPFGEYMVMRPIRNLDRNGRFNIIKEKFFCKFASCWLTKPTKYENCCNYLC